VVRVVVGRRQSCARRDIARMVADLYLGAPAASPGSTGTGQALPIDLTPPDPPRCQWVEIKNLCSKR